MTEASNDKTQDLWASPLLDDASVAAVLAAMIPYPVRSSIRNSPAMGQDILQEQMRDRLLECLAHRLHAIFMKTWDPNEEPVLQAEELPMLTGSGACIISLADAFRGWPGRRIKSFHENAKAGMILGHVDLELTACWVLRQRLGITDDKAKLDMLIDPSDLDLLLGQMVIPEHAARNLSFRLQQKTSATPATIQSLPAGPRF